MKYIMLLAIFMIACSGTDSTGPQEPTSYEVHYCGTVKGEYSVWYRNPENGDIGHNTGIANPSGEWWNTVNFDAYSGDTLWAAGSAQYGLELMISVNDSIWAIGQFCDTTHVELVLP